MADKYTPFRELLGRVFADAESDFRDGQIIGLTDEVTQSLDRMFASDTQAYREALVASHLFPL